MSKPVIEMEKPSKTDYDFLKQIEKLDLALMSEYESNIRIDHTLNRKIVSFQGNKEIPFYRWYKYKEGFSSHLVEYYIRRHGIGTIQKVLDPFAGSGATLFGASDLGIDAFGIELLPIGQHIIRTRNLLAHFAVADFERLVLWKDTRPWVNHNGQIEFTVFKITEGAYSEDNSTFIKKYLSCM